MLNVLLLAADNAVVFVSSWILTNNAHLELSIPRKQYDNDRPPSRHQSQQSRPSPRRGT